MYIPKAEPGPGDCRFNCGVICTEDLSKCQKCGWNPLVAALRSMKLRRAARRTEKSAEENTYE